MGGVVVIGVWAVLGEHHDGEHDGDDGDTENSRDGDDDDL